MSNEFKMHDIRGYRKWQREQEEKKKEKEPCRFIDENNQCSNEEVDSLECLERHGKNCNEKEQEVG